MFRWTLVIAAAIALAGCSTETGSAWFSGDEQVRAALAADPNIGMLGEPVGGTDVGDADPAFVMPSSNAENEELGWAHVTIADGGVQVGAVRLEFVSTRTFASCFEYRADEEATTDPRDNFNTDVLDGLWPFVCQNDDTQTLEIEAAQFVDVRMVFGAERDERFDWTRFYVATETSKDDCKQGRWQALGFRNQGQCIQYVNTGRDSR